MTCIICQAGTNELLCVTCKKDAFKVEKARQKVAEEGNTELLKKLYNKTFAEIKNVNTGVFWDTIWEGMESLEQQDGMTQDRVKAVAGFIPENVNTLLDVGAGYGFIEELLQARKNINITGNDISKESIRNLKKRFKGKFTLESIYSMRYSPKTFDVLLMLEVLEHIPPSRTFEVLKTVKTILKPNGYFIVSVPTNEGLEEMRDNPNGHLRMYTYDLLNAELEIAGFKILQYKTFIAFQSFYPLRKFIAKILKNTWQPNNIVILAQSV